MRFLAIALPLIFTAPGLFYLLGIPALEQENYLWVMISVALMILAVFFMVKGIRTLLQGFFGNQKSS